MKKYVKGAIGVLALIAVCFGIGFVGNSLVKDVREELRKKDEAYKIFRKAEKHFDSNGNYVLESDEVARMAVRLGYDGIFPEIPLKSTFEYQGSNRGYLTISGTGYYTQVHFPISRLEEAIGKAK